MAEVKWIKITVDMFDNRKIKYLRKLPDGNNIVLIWVMLLTMAGRCNSGGMIFLTENIPYTPKMLADELGFEENTVVLALQALENLNMIIKDEKVFQIVGWEEHQNADGLDRIREQTRKRVAKHREKQKQLPCNDESNVTSNVTVTHGNATEVEVEVEEELDNNKLLISNDISNFAESRKFEFKIPLNDGSYYHVEDNDINHWKELYPSVNVEQELRNLIGWNESNPKKRKTRAGIKKHITCWLQDKQNNGSRQYNIQKGATYYGRKDNTFVDNANNGGVRYESFGD